MANINLSSQFKNSNDLVSQVDSNIKINKEKTDAVIYSDLKLDLTFDEITDRFLNAKESTRDLQRITDEEAIITSVRNILTTNVCDRLLNPEMNLDLRSYLFNPLTEAKAYFMAYDIYNILPKYEPRISVTNINVAVDTLNDLYEITLNIVVPSLNKNLNLQTILSSTGYSIDA